MKLDCDARLLDGLRRDAIDREELGVMIERCEAERAWLDDNARGTRIAHGRIGYATLWAEYQPLADGRVRVVRAYSHRMIIKDAVC